jgi:hypothetical protein
MYQPTSLFVLALDCFQERPCKKSILMTRKKKKAISKKLLPPGLKWLSKRIRFDVGNLRFMLILRNIFANNFVFAQLDGTCSTRAVIFIRCDDVEKDFESLESRLGSELNAKGEYFFISFLAFKNSVARVEVAKDKIEKYTIFCLGKDKFLFKCLSAAKSHCRCRKLSFILNNGHAVKFNCERGEFQNDTEGHLIKTFNSND